MSIGCSIYFTPVDRSWTGSPDFVRRLAALFETVRFESLRVWRRSPVPPDDPWNDQQLLVELQAPSIDEAVAGMSVDHEHTTIMHFADADTGLLTAMAESALAALPDAISQGFAPLEASIHLGRWEVYDQGGDFRDAGSCCVELGNLLGYPVGTQEYLRGFLAVPDVVRFRERLEEFSGRPWEALIELT